MFKLRSYFTKKVSVIALIIIFTGLATTLYYNLTRNNKLTFNRSVLIDPSLPRLVDIARSNINNLSAPKFEIIRELARILVRIGRTEQALSLVTSQENKKFIFKIIAEEQIRLNDLEKAKKTISQHAVSSMVVNESLAIKSAENGDIVLALDYFKKLTFKPARNLYSRRLLRIRLKKNLILKKNSTVAAIKLSQEFTSWDVRVSANILIAKTLYVSGKHKNADTLFAQTMKMIQSFGKPTTIANIDFNKRNAYTRVLQAQVSLGRLKKGHEINKKFLNSEQTDYIIYSLLNINDTQNASNIIQDLKDNKLRSRHAYSLMRKQLELDDIVGAKSTVAIITNKYYQSLAYLRVALSLAKNKDYKQAKQFINDSDVIIKSLVNLPHKYDAHYLLIQAYIATDQLSLAALRVQKNIDRALASGNYTQVYLRDLLIQQCNIYDMKGALTTLSHIKRPNQYIYSLDSIVEAYAAHGEIDKALEMAKLIPDTRKSNKLSQHYNNKAASGKIMDIYRAVGVQMLGERHSDVLYSIVTTQARKINISSALKTIMRLENNDDRIRALVGVIGVMTEDNRLNK